MWYTLAKARAGASLFEVGCVSGYEKGAVKPHEPLIGDNDYHQVSWRREGGVVTRTAEGVGKGD